jgi:WD40 repeat protein
MLLIKIWDMNTYTLKNTLYGHKEAILALTISQNGKMLASGSQDNTIKLWNMDEVVFQIDSSDAVFAIVQPQAASHDIHMGRCWHRYEQRLDYYRIYW